MVYKIPILKGKIECSEKEVIKLRMTKDQLDDLKKSLNTDRLWSWSRVHTFMVSHYEYFLKYIAYEKEDRCDSIYTTSGGMAHSILEKLYENKIKYEDMEDEFENAWTTCFDIAQLKFDRNDEEKNSKIADKYYANLQHFFKNHCLIPYKTSIEKFVTIKIDNEYLQGYIDCVFLDNNNKIHIVDFKTSSIYRGTKAEDECGQLVLYALALIQKGVPIENIIIEWNFLKYVDVTYHIKKDNEEKHRQIERSQIGEKLQSNAKTWLKHFGYEPDEYLKDMLDTNSIDVLPQEVQDKFVINDCYVSIELTQKLIDKWVNLVSATMKDIRIREKDYQEQQNEKLFWDSEDNIKKQEYYFATLCSYSPNKLKPYKEYLDKKEQQQQGMDFFSGVGSDTITDSDSVKIDDDLSWLNELKV